MSPDRIPPYADDNIPQQLDFYTERIFKNLYHFDNNYIVKPKQYGDMLLYQTGEMACASDTVVSAHTHHGWYELTYIFDGCGKVYANGVATYVEKGDVYISLPEEEHMIEADPMEPCRFFFCAFCCVPESPFEHIVESAKLRTLNETERCYNILSLSDDFRAVLREVNSEDEISVRLLEYRLKTAILYIVRRVMKEGDERYTGPKIDRSDLICYNIMNYIDTHLTRIKSLTEIAEIFGYNYSHMSRKFKENVGKTITAYYEERRVEKAKQYLEAGMSVTTAAETLNYSSIYVFSRSFKREVGCSPVKYRKNKLEEAKNKKSKIVK